MIVYTPPKPAETIPVIDVGASDDPRHRTAIAWEIHKACRDTGFFYVAGHGVPASLLQTQLDWAARFFDLPLERKLAVKFVQSSSPFGYEPMLRQVLDEGSAPDLKEAYMCSATAARGILPDGVDDPVNRWPEDLPGFRAQMGRYQQHMRALAGRLVRLLALSLDLPADYLDVPFADAVCAVRLLHYPPQPSAGAGNQLGAGAHTDWGAITLLLQDDAGGLEVRNAANDWIRATPIPGTLVVNLGDLIRRWTNDLYQSTLHRVLNNRAGRDRYSVATFVSPDHGFRVECLPTCRPERGDPRYPACTVGDHMRAMATATYG